MSRKVHDFVARNYNSENGIVGAKNRAATEMLAARYAGARAGLRVADLGVGDGALLEQLAQLPAAMRFTGLDVSRAMLEAAGRRVLLTPVVGSAARASELLPHGAFDLLLAHFIFAYVDRRVLLAQARRLLAPGGVLSLVTSTEEGGEPFYEALECQFLRSRNPLRRLIGWACRRGLADSSVPGSWPALEADLAAAGYRVEARRTLRIPVVFEAPRDAYRYGIEEGWAANFLAIPGVPLVLAKALARVGLGLCEYPFRFVQVVEIVEASVARPPS